ncbi:hypothetical protein ACFQVA_34760 [Actinomadura keratinilytica]
MSTQTPGRRVRFDALGIATTDLTASSPSTGGWGWSSPRAPNTHRTSRPRSPAESASCGTWCWPRRPRPGAAGRSWPSCATRRPGWTPCTPS